MATSTVKTCKTDKIFADYDRNVRSAWKYRVEPKVNFNPEKDAPGFYEDIMLRGVQVKIEVAELTDAQKDQIEKKFSIRPDYRVIRGHRRFKAVELIRQIEPTFHREMSCVVYKGLTEVEELQLLCDHAGTEPLNEFEIYQAIKRLRGTPLSQEAIAQQIGQTRQWTQDRIHIMAMPQCVEDNYRKKYEPVDGKEPVKGKDYVAVTAVQYDGLYKAYNADLEAKLAPESEASQFFKLWSEITTQTAPGTRKAKPLSAKEIADRAGLVRGREALEKAHSFYAGDPNANLNEAVEAYDALMSKAGMVPKLNVQINDLQCQIDDLRHEVEQLRAENDALKGVANGAVHV